MNIKREAVCLSIPSTRLFEVEERIEELKALFEPVKGDISSLDDHEEILYHALDRFGKINMLVNNAGVALAKGDFAYSTGLIVEVSGGMNIRRL